MAEDRIDQLYSYLKQGGIVSKDRESFRKKMLAPGQEGYKNRYTIWKIMHDNGFTGHDSYEDFAKNGLGLHAVPSPTSQGGGRVGGAAAVQRYTQPTKPKRQGGGMSAAERARFINNTQGMVNSSAAAIQRTKNQMDYAKGNAGLKVKPVHLGQNSKVVKRNTDGTVAEQRPVLDMAPQEQPGQTYVTESGNEYGNRAEADTEQNAVDQYNYDNSLDGQLNNAYAERDRLDEALKRRRAELEDKPWWRRALEDMGKATHSDLDPMATANDPEHQGYENDEEYMQLMSAARKNHQTIQTLEDKKNGKMNDFWHSFGTTAMNGYTFADGMPELRDATALEYAKKHIKAINEKRQKGLPLTREEQAAEAVLKANDTDNAVQSMYGDYGAWGRAGGMTANSVDFMKDFLLMPGGAGMAKGIAGKVAGIGGKMLAKEAGESALKAIPKTIARATLKATGVLVGAHTAGSVISNTTGMGRTAALMAQKASGNVTRDEKGGYKIENEQSLMHALASAEREQARENGSEMFGEFIPGGKLLGGLAKKGLEKIGLSKVSNFLTQIGNKEWYKQYSQFLKTGGYNGIPGEALEEYEGELFDALTGHASDAWKDFTDAKQNTDIWLGCATMGALMGAIPMGIHMGGYYKFRHDMNKADKVAAYRMTKDKWVPLKEELDNTDNGHMADVVTKRILMNNELSAQEKKAAMDYVRGLTNFRGFNIAQASNAGDEESQANQARNDAYRTGYNAVDDAAAQQQPTEPIATGSDGDSAVYGGAQDGQQQTGQQGASPTEHDIKMAYEQARDGVAGMYGEDFVQQLDDDPDAVLATLEDESRGKQKAQAYVDAKAMYDGMMQRAKDDLDDKVQTVENEVDSHVNPVDQGGDGMIHPATMKVKNDDGTEHQVYIVSGHVEMMADGTMVDKTKSSPSIVIRDPQTGETKMVSPDDILSVDEPIDPEQEKQTAVEAARQEFAGQRADQIDGLAPKQNPQMNDEVWVKDENDEPVHGVVTQVDPVTGEYMVRTDKAVNGKVAQPFQAGQLYEMATTTGAAAEQRPTEPSFNEQQTETETTDNEQQTETEQPTETETTETGQPAETEADADLALKGTAQNHTEGEEQVETREDGQPQRAIDRIPSEQVTDKKGNTKTVHHWEQAEPGDTWDALNEQYQDDKRTQHKVGIRVKKIDDQIKSLDKQIKKLDDSDDFDADFNDADGYKALLEQKKELEAQKKYWQQVQSVPQQRKLDEDRRTAEEKAAAEAARKQAERQGVNTEPSEKQKEAGNYKKGHIKVDGYDITIENPKGSTRSGKDASGKAWSVPMHYDYGYIKGTEGVDGDHIDVYLSDNPTSGNVYVVDQIDQKTGKFDEHKVMYGFPSKEAAVEAYKRQYTDGWKVGTVTEVSREDFKKWVESSRRKTKPFSEYKSVKDAAQQQEQLTDLQGNPILPDGTLIRDAVSSIDQITDEYFTKPFRSVQLPIIPRNIDKAIGANGKPVIIKKNIFEKNAKTHQFTPAESRRILKEALYNTDLVGRTQPKKRPNHWVAIKVDEESPITVLEVNENKDNVEVVGWYRLDDRNLERIKRQAEREGGELLILTPKGAAASLSTLPLNSSSVGKDKQSSPKKQEKTEKKNEGQFGLVSDERMEELKKRLRAKLNNLNMGVDPEVLAIGLELTAGYIDRGVKKFAEYSKAMINDLGDVVRPYLKAFYNGVRDMPEITSNGLDAEMDDYETVSKFNVATIGKEGEEVKPSILDTAEQVSNESHVERAASNVSDEDVKSEQKKLKGEDKTSGLHEVNTDRLFKDLKAGKTVVLNDYYKDEDMSKGMDLMIEEAHDKFLSKLNTFKEKPTREMLEKALKDREQWIDELADMFKKGKTEGVVNGKYQKKVDVAGSLAIMLGERKAIQELLGMDLNGGSTAQQRPTELSTSAERTEQNPTEHGTTETDTSVADSKRKQFDLFVKWDLERFIGKSKAKRVTVDWEHSEPENDYLPMKIDGEPSFVGVTEQDGEGYEIDRPIAIYDIAEGGDFPDVPKTAEFEAYAKDYNAENNLTENSDDYATMDANNPYVAFRSVDAAVKFNDWLHEKGKGAAAEQRRTEPSEKKENTRYSERGFTLRPATEEDVDSNKAIYVNGKRTHIVMVVRKGEQVGAAQFSHPVIEAVYTTDNERVPLSKIEVEDLPTTVHLKTAGDFYEAYGNDAVALGEVTGVSVVTRKDGTRMAGFPKKMLDEYEQGLRNNGWDVSVDGMATKKATENILQQLQSAPKARTSTNAIKNALRGKKTSSKENNEKKKAVSSQQDPSLFDDLFGGKEVATKRQPTEQKATQQTSERGTAEQKPAVISTDDEKGKEKPIETKPAEELSGDSKEYQARAKAEQEFVERIKGMITEAAKDGRSLTMSDIKKAYNDELDGNWELPNDYKDTDLQELVERAMTLATREVAIGAISKNTSEAVREGYDKVVKLYESQPSLNARDSSRVAHQQYSTPTPFGYVMDMFMMGGDKKPLKLLEPSAGNGALTIGIPAPLWHVNDIDERRLMNLRTMPYGKITNQDGTMPFEPKAYDAVATNPPFGSTQEKEFDGGRTKISSLEGLMAINALASMKDDGRAAIIIGGNTQYMSNGAMQAKDMKLFKHLYTHYNVVDVINLDGDMYKRNGTGYNVRMILIAGRKTDVGDNPEKFTFPPVKKKARAEQVKTFDELYKRVEDDIQRAKQMERESPVAVNSNGSHTVNSASERTGNSETAGGVQQQPVRAGEVERRPQPGRTVRPSSAQDGRGNGERGQHGSADRLDHADQRNAGSNHAVSGNGSAQGQSSERRESGSTGRRAVGGTERGRTAQRDNANGKRLEVTGNSAAVQQRPTEPSASREKVELGQEKVAYPNKSQSMTLQSRVPAAQAEAIAENLDKLGDVDEMVRSELGYSSKDELYSHLAAEQIDSVALAINQMKHGKGFIIGDMTGVGKGRQGAALIRWAIKQGKTPIYFTQKARLYTDNYRDMCDIGSKGLHPFLIASNDDGNIVENVVDENGEKVYDKNGEPVTRVVYGLPKPKERERVYDYILQNGKLPPEYDYVLVTYSQIQSGTKTYEIGKNGEIEVKDKKYKGKKPTGAETNGDVRRDVLEKLAKDNYVFLDESHTVGGQSSSGLYMQDMLKGAEGVTYLSATFAKRPDNMPLYAMKTAMSESGLSQKDMIDAIQKGGVTLQEIMSKQLVQSGQMIRRERDFSGVSIDWEGVDEETDQQQRAQFDEVAKIFNAIREFQDTYVDPSIEKMSEDMAEEGKFSKKTQGTSHMGVNNVPFASKMYNLVNQLLFSLKANAVADKAIECLKKGEKPVISFNNTMEGFLDDMPRNTPMPELPNFSLTLMRALEGTLRYTEGEVGNKDNQVNKTLNINDLSDEAVAEYNKIRKTILNLSIGLPIDPMDAIKMRIEAAGYKVGEITGRKSEMVKDADGNYIVQSRSSKEMDGKAAASAFNSASGKNGGLDVLLINKSGSTGISLHASSKFTDQSPRVMIAAQFQSDINDEVQMRGRIDRTGQVHRGRYIYLVSSIPAEQRLQMMFKNKLKSLDANTTSSQKSKFNEMEVTDFMNKYGDEVTWSYMMEHPDLEERLGDPLDMLSDESKKSNRRDGDEENNQNSGCAGKILRRLPFLSVKEQEQIFNDLADAYKVKMQILNDAGENDLEITTMPLRAETKSRKVWKQGSDPGSDNAFADNTYLETAEVDVLKKPMKAKEVREYADRLTDGKPWEQWHQEQHEAVEQFYADKAKAVEDKAKADAQKRIDKAREDYIKGCLKARKKGDNNWSDEEISHMADIAAKEAADKEQTKINKRTVSIDAQLNDVLEALDAFTPLEPLIIPLNLKDTSTTVIPSLGTFLGIKFGKGYSRSSSTAVFATLDGRRKIEVPLSDKTSLENIKHQSVMLGYQARGLNMDNWDSKVPTKSRKTAYIVTGNLMQALVDTQKAPETKGQLISYTTIDGDVKQGILMNDRFKVEDLKTSVPISAMLQKVKEGDAVESTDKEVTIERGTSYHYNDYKLSVPKSKSRGGKYFLDKKLLRLLDDEFTTSGGNMVSWVSESNLKKVLDYLSKDLGVTVQVKANLEEATDSPHNDEPATPSEAEEGGVLYREVDDEEAARLDREPTVKVYRAMQEHDGKLYPPMSGRVKTQVETKNGNMRTKWVWRSPIEIGKWEQSEEHPEMANEDGTFTLDKGNGSKINAAYNPYIHTSRTPINDQFSSAWNRPELVTVEVEVPASELTSGYHAEKAKDATGEVEWKSGPVGREMAAQGNPRMVILSRWDKPVRIVPVEEVADEYAVRLAGTGIKVPFNTVPPALREALVARGVEISEPEEGNAGKASRPSYEEWLKGNTRHREGSGAYSDEELSLMNDPVAKWLGKSNRTKAQQKAFANRERRSMESAVRELADRLHLDNVNIVMDASTLEGRKARAKGFYDRNTGQITIVIPNHRDVDDVMQTLLHEGVAHYGLRQLFGEHFDTFLRNVYEAADNEVRRKIIDLALHKYGGNFETATEEYLASLAERTNFENMPYTFWMKIKRMFLAMLHDIGFENFADTHAFTLSDNELRYILWRSYENLKEPGRYRSILGEAEDVAKQAELKVGNYGEAAAQQRPTGPSTTEQQAIEQQPREREREAAEGEVGDVRSLIRRLVSLSKKTKEKMIRLVIGKVNRRQIRDLRSEGLDVDDSWRHSIENSRIIHAQRRHGITDADFERIPEILDSYDNVHVSDNKNNSGNKVVIYEKKYSNGTTYYLEEVRNGRHSLAFQTMYKKESGDSDGLLAKPTPKRSETTSDNSTTSTAKLGNSSESGVNKGENVSEPAAWGKKDLLSKAEQISHGIEPDLLFRDTIEDDDDTARETYNAWADDAKNKIREAWQDSMINVRNLQEAVLKQRGEKMDDWEDAYNEENRSHGQSRAESEYFTDNLYKPLLKAVNAVAKTAKVSIGDVTEYMMAKHGLERNEVFARRDAQAAYDKAMEKAKGTYDALMNAANAESDPKKKDALEKQAQKVTFPDFDDLYQHFRLRDYAGLTDLTGQSDVQDAEVEAKRIVADMEARAGAAAMQRPTQPGGLIGELWKATNEATGWTLEKAYESGIISKGNYEQVSRMFNYYIPLRGWDETTADDLYDYVGSGDKGTAFSPTVHKAKGRRSQADNPIAYIGSMAVSAIVQGNKNKVKQSFMRFVENHPTNLVTVSEMWYRNYGTDAAPDWREDVPNIPEDATADEIADIVKQHEDDMKQLEEQGLATKERGRLHLGVPVKQGQALEHHVEVMVNGKKYVLYINGNPRAAQALNGTRMRRASERSFESSKVAAFGRKLAERYTSLSPSFTVGNAFRDLTMAAISTAIKESPAYAIRFRLNVARLGGPARMFTLMKWYKKAAAQQLPTGQMSETERYFYEFMTHGAETGFTSLKEINEYKDDMQKMYKNMNQKVYNPKRLFRGLSEGLEYTNRCIEDMTRFAIYMASRQSGRSVRESTSDAKNITLNFNRKGSGEMGNATYRNLQIFVNPAIQSLQNVASMAMDHPVKFTLFTGAVALIGAAQVFATQLLWSMFGGGDGDDDDKWNAVDEYWKLPSWQRRNNLVMWIPGTRKFAMIPLAQEFRVFHGFGETLTTTLQGKGDENAALELMSQVGDLLPLDFAGNNGNMLINMAPTVTQPLLQVGFNTDFTGRPLYKDNDFNKYEPSFQKAYVGTPSWLIKSSEMINDLTGGDEHKQGWWERTKVGGELNNPAVVDHLLKGYYGGLYSFLAQTGGTMLTVASGKLPDVQEVPIANRIVTAVRETQQNGKAKLPDWYYDLSEESKRHQNEFSGYKKDYLKGDKEGKKKLDEIIKSKDFVHWQQVNAYIGAVQQIRTAMSYEQDEEEKQKLQKNLDEVLGELEKLR